MAEYVNQLNDCFLEYRDASRALQMKKYLRNQFEFYGLTGKQRMEVSGEHIAKYGIPGGNELGSIIEELWEKPQREFQHFGMVLVNKDIRNADANIINIIEYMITSKSWWDTVDYIAIKLAGELFRIYPELINSYAEKWIDSENIWLQRSAILFQHDYRNNTDTGLLFRYINRTKDSKEFFIRKAIGWILRNYSKTDHYVVEQFINSNKLSPLSEREARKGIERAKRKLQEAK